MTDASPSARRTDRGPRVPSGHDDLDRVGTWSSSGMHPVCHVSRLPRSASSPVCHVSSTIRDSTARCHGEPEGRVMYANVRLLPPPPLLSYPPPCPALYFGHVPPRARFERQGVVQPPGTLSALTPRALPLVAF